MFEPRKDKLKSAAIMCMDEHVLPGEDVVKLGLVASGVVDANGNGNQKLYPDTTRQLMEKAAPIVIGHLARIANDIGLKFGITSHPGCGGAGAQEIPADQLSLLTQKQMQTDKVRYWGHMQVADTPQSMDFDSEVEACITRPEDDHVHTAEIIIWTVGFGITRDEYEQIKEKFGEGFHDAVEGFGAAVRAEELTFDEADKLLLLQDKIAQAIAPGVKESGNQRHLIFDAQRLNKVEALANARLIQVMLGIIGIDDEVREDLIVRLK